MPSDIRIKRIEDQIRRVISEIIESKVNDPRVESVYVTDVTVDRELDFANIYVSSLAGATSAEDILAGLQNASSFIRYTLSQEIKLRVMPKLRFYWDETPDRAERIETLLSEIRGERDQQGEITNTREEETKEELNEDEG